MFGRKVDEIMSESKPTMNQMYAGFVHLINLMQKLKLMELHWKNIERHDYVKRYFDFQKQQAELLETSNDDSTSISNG
jgi:hypothetical protein